VNTSLRHTVFETVVKNGTLVSNVYKYLMVFFLFELPNVRLVSGSDHAMSNIMKTVIPFDL